MAGREDSPSRRIPPRALSQGAAMSLMIAILFLQASLDRAQTLLREGKVSEARIALGCGIEGDAGLSSGADAARPSRHGRKQFRSRTKVVYAGRDSCAAILPAHSSCSDFSTTWIMISLKRNLSWSARASSAPTDSRTALFLALTYEGLAQPQLAEDLFKEALRRPSVEAHVAYARMLFSSGRFDEAQTQVARALGMNANSREALYEQARLDFERGKFADCIATAERA